MLVCYLLLEKRLILLTSASVAMPEIVKRSFIYRKVWNDIWRRKKNATFIVTGATGSGKSSVALRMAEDLDPLGFSVERVVYNTEDFLRLLVEGDSKGKLKIGSCLVFDESSHDEAMDSRSSLSKTNKTMASISTIFRAKRIICFFVVPNLNQLDSRVRAISVTALLTMKKIDYEKNKSLADFFWVVQNPKTGEVYHKRPRLLKENGDWIICDGVWFNRPSKELEKEYESKKMSFIDDKVKRWYEETKDRLDTKKSKTNLVSANVLAKKVLAHKDNFMANNRISRELVMKEFGVGLDKAKSVVRIARLDEIEATG